MKIHYLPPPPPSPPAPPPKALATAFEIEQATQELTQTAQQRGARRITLRKVHQEAKPERNERQPKTEEEAKADQDDKTLDIFA